MAASSRGRSVVGNHAGDGVSEVLTLPVDVQCVYGCIHIDHLILEVGPLGFQVGPQSHNLSIDSKAVLDPLVYDG